MVRPYSPASLPSPAQRKKKMENHNNELSRRHFIQLLGLGGAATTAALAGCKNTPAGNAAAAATPGDGKMTYRAMPGDPNKVSLLGFGMMRLPMKENAEDTDTDADGNPVNNIDQDELNRLVDYAIAHGVNYFDTSPRYTKGFSEPATGIALSRHKRSEYIVATKLSNFAEEAQSYEASVAMYRNSFKNLKVDYIDYYLLHSIGNVDNYKKRYIDNGVLDFLVREREAGRIRHLGWSFHGTKEFFDYMLQEQPVKFDFVQIQMNYKDWRHSGEVNAEYLYNELAKRDIPAVIMEPLLGGGLAKVNHKVLAMFQRQDPTRSAAYWAFRFCGHYPGVLTVLSGMNRLEHLQDNISTYSPLEKLSQQQLDMLQHAADLIDEFPLIDCTGCNYCMPCPYGINIPAVFAHYNKCLNEGNFTEGANDPNYARLRRAFLIGYDRSVPRLRQADHCIACGKCKEACPQHIDIPEEMHTIDTYVEQLKRNPE